MNKLLDRKREIIEKHLPKVMEKKIKANEQILKLLTNAVIANKITAAMQVNILNRINAGGKIDKEESSDMKGNQKLELAKAWFENARNTLKDLDEDVKLGYGSYLKSIDEEMDLVREEIKQIDEELKKTEDKQERQDLLNERREKISA
jgi:hypothetical protein